MLQRAIFSALILSALALPAHAAPYIACRGGTAAPEKIMATCNKDINEAINEAARAMAYQARGNVYKFRKKYDLALKDWAKAIELYPAAIHSYFNAGVVYLTVKPEQFDKAIASFSKFIELRPQDGKGWYARAQAHAKAGNEEMALSDFRKSHQCGSRAAMLELKKRGLKPGPSLVGCD